MNVEELSESILDARKHARLFGFKHAAEFADKRLCLVSTDVLYKRFFNVLALHLSRDALEQLVADQFTQLSPRKPLTDHSDRVITNLEVVLSMEILLHNRVQFPGSRYVKLLEAKASQVSLPKSIPQKARCAPELQPPESAKAAKANTAREDTWSIKIFSH